MTLSSFFADLTLKGPLFCSFVQLELRMSKTYWIRQNIVQNKTDVQNLENIRRILAFLASIFFQHYETFIRKFFDYTKVPPSFFEILEQNGCSKIQKGPLLHFSALLDFSN